MEVTASLYDARQALTQVELDEFNILSSKASFGILAPSQLARFWELVSKVQASKQTIPER